MGGSGKISSETRRLLNNAFVGPNGPVALFYGPVAGSRVVATSPNFFFNFFHFFFSLFSFFVK